MLGRLIAIPTFSRRTDCLTGTAKVIDGDTIVVAGELIRLHGSTPPELDQTFWWRGQQIAFGTMSLAALEALIAGVKVAARSVASWPRSSRATTLIGLQTTSLSPR